MDRRCHYRFAPGADAERIAALLAVGPDVLIIDLEDAVAEARKDEARATTRQALADLDWSRTARAVRINSPDEAAGILDIDAVVASADLIIVPKIRSSSDVLRADAVIGAAEVRAGVDGGSTPMCVMIEQAAAVVHAAEILAASDRITSAFLGPADLSADLRYPAVRAEGFAYHHALLRHCAMQFIVACAAAGVDPISSLTLIPPSPDPSARSDAVRELVALGFRGLAVLDDADLPLVEEAFTPTAGEVAFAEGVLSSYEEAARAGQGVGRFAGVTVRAPNVAMARLVIERARSCGGEAG